MKTRRRKYRNQFPDAFYKVRKEKALAPASVWSLRDKLSVAGGLALAVLVFFSAQLISTFKHRKEISDRVEAWQKEFALDTAQVETLREIEFDLHGDWSPRSNPPNSSDLKTHREEIAKTMGPEMGNRFLTLKSNNAH